MLCEPRDSAAASAASSSADDMERGGGGPAAGSRSVHGSFERSLNGVAPPEFVDCAIEGGYRLSSIPAVVASCVDNGQRNAEVRQPALQRASHASFTAKLLITIYHDLIYKRLCSRIRTT
jgi:hypothetical protein